MDAHPPSSPASTQAPDQALREFELALEMAGFGTWVWDLRSGEVHWSPACYRLSGLSPESPLTIEDWRGRVHPDDRARVEQLTRQALSERTRLEITYRVVRPDGAVRWLRGAGCASYAADGSPVRARGVLQDVTKQRESRDAARATDEAFRLAVEAAQIGVWERRLPDGPLEGSEAWHHVIGHPPGSVRTFEDLLELIDPEDRPGVRATVQQALETGRDWKIDYRIVLPGGGSRWMHSVGRPYRDKDGAPDHVRGVLMDVSDRKRDEVELRQRQQQVELLNIQLQRRALDAETAKLAKEALLRNVSHEFRTPLNHIVGGAQLLSMGAEDDRQKKWLRIISDAAQDLLKLVDRTLSAAARSGDDRKLDKMAFSPATVLREVRLLMLPRAEAKGLELKIGRVEGLPAVLLGDPVRVTEALMNYVDNAIKFTDRGQVTLSARSMRVDGETMCRFEVSDTGPGIDPDIRQKLFKPFEQGDTSMRRLQGGLGLGLSSTRKLIHLMGGEVGFESEVGAGSTFWFAINCPPA